MRLSCHYEGGLESRVELVNYTDEMGETIISAFQAREVLVMRMSEKGEGVNLIDFSRVLTAEIKE